MINLYYKIRTSFIFNYKYNEKYDTLLSHCLACGIYHVKSTEHDLKIIFKNGVEFDAWNANKYYAWLSRAYFSGSIKASFDECRPSVRIMYKLNKAIKNHSNIYSDLDSFIDLFEKNINDCKKSISELTKSVEEIKQNNKKTNGKRNKRI